MDNMPKMDVYFLPFISSRNDTIIAHQSRFGLGKEASTSNEKHGYNNSVTNEK